jgi:hypothetical protein
MTLQVLGSGTDMDRDSRHSETLEQAEHFLRETSLYHVWSLSRERKVPVERIIGVATQFRSQDNKT